MGGAIVRNKKGEVVAFRRNLISDYKYNQSGIIIIDDFDEVWGKRENNIDNNNNINLNNTNKRSFYTINVNSNNNFSGNNNYNMSSLYDFNNNNYNFNNNLDNKIYERRMKLLQLKKKKRK